MDDLLVIPQPFAPGYCNKAGFTDTTYVMYECATDGQSITKKVYSDAECTVNDVNTADITYDSRDGLQNGDLNDFNCVGKENVVAYDAYFPICSETPLATAYLATDICYKYQNSSNVTNDQYPDVPNDAWYQLTQINLCEGDELTFNTYINEGCGASSGFATPQTSFTANGECGFFKRVGISVQAQVTECIKDGVSVFNSTDDPPTPQPTNDNNAKWMVMAAIIGCVCLMFGQ